jgi:Na+/H+ antiporter NhaD/arsenite permease-like protein
MTSFEASFAHNHWLPAAIFVITYIFIAIESGRGSHLDRTAAAFCGAVAMILVGAISLDQSYQAIDWNTLIFLLGIMILVAHFHMAHFFDWIAIHVSAAARTRLQLMVLLVFTSGILAAFFVNDTICLAFTPIVLAITERLEIPPVPYLIGLASSANTGSVMSVTGNPQNALVGISGHLSFLGFLAHLAPVALLGLAVNLGVIVLFFHRTLLDRPLKHTRRTIEVTLNRRLMTKCALASLLIVGLWIAGYSFPLVAISVGAFILIIGRVKSQNIYQHIDWELLLFFASLFVLIQGFEKTGAVDELVRAFHAGLGGRTLSQLFAVSGMMLVLSNLVSNLPAVLLFRPMVSSFADSHLIWLAVASASTLAGNATPLSSVANLIVLQGASKKVPISYWQFARVGIVITILTTVLAVAILAAEHHFFPGR